MLATLSDCGADFREFLPGDAGPLRWRCIFPLPNPPLCVYGGMCINTPHTHMYKHTLSLSLSLKKETRPHTPCASLAQGVCFLCVPYTHTYIHTYIHTCIHTYICMYVIVHVYTYVRQPDVARTHALCAGERSRSSSSDETPSYIMCSLTAEYDMFP